MAWQEDISTWWGGGRRRERREREKESESICKRKPRAKYTVPQAKIDERWGAETDSGMEWINPGEKEGLRQNEPQLSPIFLPSRKYLVEQLANNWLRAALSGPVSKGLGRGVNWGSKNPA